jgi:hypothetical protein
MFGVVLHLKLCLRASFTLHIHLVGSLFRVQRKLFSIAYAPHLLVP